MLRAARYSTNASVAAAAAFFLISMLANCVAIVTTSSKFTTRVDVTEVSGRGVGLDAVKSGIVARTRC